VGEVVAECQAFLEGICFESDRRDVVLVFVDSCAIVLNAVAVAIDVWKGIVVRRIDLSVAHFRVCGKGEGHFVVSPRHTAARYAVIVWALWHSDYTPWERRSCHHINVLFVEVVLEGRGEGIETGEVRDKEKVGGREG
jgi:hypothetical protein